MKILMIISLFLAVGCRRSVGSNQSKITSNFSFDISWESLATDFEAFVGQPFEVLLLPDERYAEAWVVDITSNCSGFSPELRVSGALLSGTPQLEAAGRCQVTATYTRNQEIVRQVFGILVSTLPDKDFIIGIEQKLSAKQGQRFSLRLPDKRADGREVEYFFGEGHTCDWLDLTEEGRILTGIPGENSGSACTLSIVAMSGDLGVSGRYEILITGSGAEKLSWREQYDSVVARPLIPIKDLSVGVLGDIENRDVTYRLLPASTCNGWVVAPQISNSGLITGTPAADSTSCRIDIEASRGSESIQTSLAITIKAQKNSLPYLNIYSDNGDPLFIVNPEHEVTDLSGKLLADMFLRKKGGSFGVASDLSNVEYTTSRKSLVGNHYHYRQISGGGNPENSGISISILKGENRVYLVYNYMQDIPQGDKLAENTAVNRNEDELLEMAWNHIGASASLLSLGQIESVGFKKADKIVPAYKVIIAVSEPLGEWEVIIDATDLSILAKRNRLKIFTEAVSSSSSVVFSSYQQARRAFLSRNQLPARVDLFDGGFSSATQVNGQGLVFDPDPISTLQDSTLNSGSDLSGALKQKSLKDISYQDGFYTLDGPWVEIADFSNGRAGVDGTPSRLVSGNFAAGRSTVMFREAVAYYHIDNSQRYLQSLGYIGEAGLQNVNMKVDVEGAQGKKNAYYWGTANRIEVGYSKCNSVASDRDIHYAEASGVLIHEYGHALQKAMLPDFSGGDTDAIGEGFSDYWALSHRYRSDDEGARKVLPNEPFPWSCLSRPADKVGVQYEEGRNYGAHESLGVGSAKSDQLWSTPLFQSYLELRKLGVSQEDIDKVILQGHYGLGDEVTMPIMAASTLLNAHLLQPDKPEVAATFLKKFMDQKIVSDILFVEKDVVITSLDNSNEISPGKEVWLRLRLRQNGGANLTGVKAELSSQLANISISNATITYGEIKRRSVSPVVGLFRFAIPVSHEGDLGLSLRIFDDSGYAVTREVVLEMTPLPPDAM